MQFIPTILTKMFKVEILTAGSVVGKLICLYFSGSKAKDFNALKKYTGESRRAISRNIYRFSPKILSLVIYSKIGIFSCFEEPWDYLSEVGGVASKLYFFLLYILQVYNI